MNTSNQTPPESFHCGVKNSKAFSCLDAFIRKLGDLASLSILLVVIVTCLIAILRYGFGMTSNAWQESALYAHAVLITLGVAYTLREDKHVRVDVFYRSFSTQKKAYINLIGTMAFLFPTCIFLLVNSVDYVSLSWTLKERSTESDGLNYLYILKTVLLIGPGLVMLQGIQTVRKCIQIIRFEKLNND